MQRDQDAEMVAVCISIGDQRSSGTIVVTGLASPAGAEVRVEIKCR